MDTKRVNGPSDPVATTRDVVVTKKVTIPVVGAPGTLIAVTNVMIASVLPPTNFTYRIQKASFYGAADPGGSVTVTDLKSDEAEFVDYGTSGSVRPQIHLRPAFELRNAWYDKATANDFYTVEFGSASPSSQGLLQLTLEVRFHV
jgi:hypothetical protein